MKAKILTLLFLHVLVFSAKAQVTGTVFRDYNANGILDISPTYNEPGFEGVTISAYGPNGILITSTISGADGTYVLAGVSGSVRVEFTWGEPFLKPGQHGASSVQFVTAPVSGVNFGINNPADYSQDFTSLNIITPCFVYGHYNDPDIANEDVIVSIPYLSADPQSAKYQQNPPMTPHIAEAISSQVGTVHGLAFQRSKDMLYAGAYHRTHSGFGPGGSGAIYVIDRSLPLNDPNRAKIFADVNAIFGANTAGVDPHPQISDNAGGNWYNDVRDPSDASSWVNTFNNVGKIAWGDLEISDDETTLYAVNLADRKLYVFPADATLAGTLTSADIQRYDIPLNWCVDNTASNTENDSRPFALKYKDGKLYVGVTCTAESIGAYNRDDVGLVIYEFTGSGFNTTPVFTVDGVNWGANTILYSWTPWVWGPSGTGFNPNILRQFFLTDIEFDNQDLILGIRDRWGDQVHLNAGLPTPSNPGLSPANNIQATAFGKVLRACWNGTTSTWSYEGGGICGTLNGYGTLGSASIYNPGPLGTNGKYNSFYEEFASHIEASMGSLIQIPGAFEVATTAMGPTGFNSGGIIWMSNIDGQNKRPLSIMSGERVGATIYDGLLPATPLNKSSGLGDVEALLDPAPIEIGNRVWVDTDEDGIQDADEAPIAGVTVQLLQGTTVIATATTDANGNYYFSSATGTNTASAIYGITQLEPNMTYIVRIPNVQGGSKQAALGTNTLTTANVGGAGQPDVRDSDGTLVGNNAEATVQTTDIAVAGANNHNFDFGFTAAPTCTVSIACNPLPQTSCTPPNGSATTTVTGAQGNLTYMWSSGEATSSITGKVAGTYTVTITDDFLTGCTSTCQAVIGSTVTLPTAQCNPTPNSNCATPNGTATVATNADQILWSNGGTTATITGLSANTYTVTVTNTTTGCTNTCQAVVTNSTVSPTCTIATNSQPSCANLTGGSVTVTPSPAGTYTYAWSDNGAATANRTGLTGGTYTVTVTNTTTNCTGVCNVTLTTPTNCCNIAAIVPQNLECLDNGTPALITDNRIRFNAMVTNTNTSLTGYNVTINGGTTITPNTNVPYGITQFTLGPGTAGGGATFTVTVTDSATPGCTQTFQVIDPGTCSPAIPECPTPKCGTATIQVNGN